MGKYKCIECGSSTNGVLLKEPVSNVNIFVESLCELCLDHLLEEEESDLISMNPIAKTKRLPEGDEQVYPETDEKKELINNLPDYVVPLPPPLGWAAQRHVEFKYNKM